MLVSSPKYLATFLILFALTFLFFAHRHAAIHIPGQDYLDYAFEPSDQTVIDAGMFQPQETVAYDKLSGDTPRDIEANWSATISAKSLLQKVRQFRLSTQASYNDDSHMAVRRTLEDAELNLENLGKSSFNTKKIIKGVEKLKVALKAAEEVILRDPGPKTMTSVSGNGDKSATQMEGALQEAEEDSKRKIKAALLEKGRRAERNVVIEESQSRGHSDLN